jgi:hypothetical protein
MIPIFTGTIRQEEQSLGELYVEYDKPFSLELWLRKINLDHRVEVIIRKPKTKRSDLQNNYYWGVVLELLSKELGYDQDEMHEILKYKFLQSHAMGMPYVKSTTKLSTGEFEEYLSKIKRWAAEFLNIVIPDPNTVI